MNVNTTLLSTWLTNLATVVGGGFAVFGDPSLSPTAKAVVVGLVPLMVSVLTYVSHSLEATKIKVAAATPTHLPAPTA